MSSSRERAIKQFVVLVVLFPLCFAALKDAIEALLSAYTWDDALSAWIDSKRTLSSTSNSSHRWLTDILTLAPTFWSIWFLLGAVDEMFYTAKMTTLDGMEIAGRWVAIAAGTQLLAPAVGVLFFHASGLVLWTPLALLLSLALVGMLFYWSSKIPGRRVRKVETIYHFEKVKDTER